MEDQGFEDKVRSESRFKALEERLERLEKFLNLGERKAAPPPPPLPVPAPPPPPPPPPLPQARRSGPGGWLGVVGVICFVLAAGFIIKLSLDSGWLTPSRQIGLAMMLGLGLIFGGLAMADSDQEYASYLPAAGVIVLYAAVFGAHRLYNLLPFGSALSLSAMISGLCVWLYTKIRQDVYPVTAAVGAYCAPALLHLGAGAPFGLYYYLLCSLAFAVISVWVKSRTLTLVATYLAMLLTAVTGLSLGRDGLTALMLALNFVSLSTGVFLYSVHNGSPLGEREAGYFMPALLFFYAMEYYFIDRLHPGLAPWLSLACAALLLGFYLEARSRLQAARLGSEALVLSFLTVVFFHSFYLELLPADARPWLFGSILLALCVPAIKLGGAGRGGPLRIPALGVLAVLAIEYLSIASHLFKGDEGQWLAVAGFSVISLWLLIFFRSGDLERAEGYPVLLGAAHLLAILGLYRLTKDSGSLYVSASWLVYSSCVIAFAYQARDAAMARSAVFALAFAAGKALLYDAAAAPTVVRILCLLLTGAALYGSGFFLRQIASWKDAGKT